MEAEREREWVRHRPPGSCAGGMSKPGCGPHLSAQTGLQGPMRLTQTDIKKLMMLYNDY